jgi:hypothetical protein
MHDDTDVDARLDRMIEIAEEVGVSLDDVVRAIGRVPQIDFLKVSDNPSLLPLYIQSSVIP